AAQVPRVDIDGAAFKAPGAPLTTGRWLPFAEENRVVAKQDIRWDGEYQVTVEYAIRGATEATIHEALMDVKAGGSTVDEVSLGWDQRRTIQLTGKAALKKGSQDFEIHLKPGREAAAGEE